MVLTEIVRLKKWFSTSIAETDLVNKYTGLINKLNTVIQPNTQNQAFEDEKEGLLVSLKNIDMTVLSMAQIEFLEKLEVKNSLGIEVANDIINDFQNYNFDIVSIRDSLNLKLQKINTSINRFTQIEKSLFDLIDEEVDEVSDGIIMRVRFDNDVSIGNVADLKQWGSQLELLLRSIAELNDQRVEDIEVISAEHGSIIYVLKVTLEIARDMGVAIAAILGCIKLYYDILQKKEEVRRMKLSNEAEQAILRELENEEERVLDKTTNDVVKELVKNLNADEIHEASTKLGLGIDVLVKFIKGGGDIDVSTPSFDELEEEHNDRYEKVLKVREQFKHIKDSQNNIKLLSESTCTENEDEKVM